MNFVICTVGTSLLQEKKYRIGKKFPPIDISSELDTRNLNQSTIEEKLSENKHPFNKVFEALKGLIPNDQLAKRDGKYEPKINPDLLPAELSSLYLFYWPDGNIPCDGEEADNKDRIILLPSETNPSIFCACCLRKYLKEKEPLKSKISEVEIIIIEGLQTKDTEKFEETALLNLSTILREKIEEGHEGNYNVVLNITGGYKAIPPYVTVIGNCFPEVDIRYLYEDSKDLVHLPPVPINFDLPTYRDYRAIIKVLIQPGFAAGESLYKVLPTNIKACFLKKRPEMELNFFGDAMIEKYRTEKINLTPYGKGLLLLDRIKDRELKKYLTGCINQWQHLWIGDKIPEMVEHQRGHTQRVLELAAEMLYPIIEDENRKIFRNNEELASFIGAIWLHDLGNSGEKFNLDGGGHNIVRGFPSLIRDFHNLITDTIIQEDENKPVKERLLFPEEVELTKNETIERSAIANIDQIIKNIRTISKYHRKWTPLTSYMIKTKDKHCIKLKKAVADKNLRFLTALYRVLDACDTQLERTVDDAYINTRKMVVEREVKIIIEEKEAIEKAGLAPGINDKNLKKIEAVKQKFNDLSWIFKNNKETKTKIDDFADYINNIVGKLITCPNLKVTEPVKRWLSCLDQIFFKKRQPNHYEKHKGVDAVMILHEGKEDGKYRFNILVAGSEETDEKRLREVLENDIYSEYSEVKTILNEYLEFKFSYRYNQEQQCYKDYNDEAS
jgi:putative CRISPR-associated protein (TIGR02619 family)